MAKIFVISGPAGVGKGTTCQWIRDNCPDLKLRQARSVTTRQRRDNDPNEWKYEFVDEATFAQMIESGCILEFAASQEGSLYGTLASSVDEILDTGHNLLMDINVDGARFMAESYPEQTVLIFIDPESFDQLGQHLRDRGTSAAEIAKRLDRATQEIQESRLAEFTHVVSREGQLDQLFSDVVTIMKNSVISSDAT